MSFNQIMAHPDDPRGQLPGTPRRATARHSLSRKVKVRFSRDQDFVTLATINISRRGMLLAAPDPPAVGSRVEIVLPLPDGRDLALAGAVVRVVLPDPAADLEPGSEAPLAGLGIALELDEAQQEQLDRYLAATVGAEVTGLPDLENATPPEARAGEPAKALLGRIQLKRVAAEAGAGARQGPAVRRSQAGAASPRAASSVKDPAVGIDFGTTSCRVGFMAGDELRILRDETGRPAIPAVVRLAGPEASVAGHDAWEQAPLEPVRTIRGIRRLLGCRAVTREVAQYLRSIACPARARQAGGVAFSLDDGEVAPVEIAAAILRHVKELAERALGQPVTRVVMSHPLSFDEDGLADLEQAASLAGLDPMALVPEPAAVALAYGYGGKPGVVGVYDFGGGSFCFTVLECGGVPAVLGAASDPWLGGDEMDLAVARAAAEEFFRVTQVDLRQRVVEWRRVVQAAEEAKILLSTSNEVELSVPRAVLTSQGEIDLCLPLTPPRFAELTGDLVYNSLRISQRALAEAGVSKDRLEALLLAGGVTRVPAVRDMATALYGREPHAAAYPERAAALGATLVAAEMLGQPAPLGPCEALVAEERVGSTIGLAMAGGVTEPLIARGTPLPTAVRRVFATFRDGQARLEVRIVTGEDRQTAANRVIGAVDVADLPAGPAGSAEVEIKFEMSSADVLNVRTHDLSSGRRRWSHFPIPR